MKFRSLLTLAAFVTALAPAVAAQPLNFVPVDPQATQTPAQVFVKDGNARVETDERGIVHDAGLRGARTDDEPNIELFNGAGDTLAFTVEKWRAANGTAEISPDSGSSGDRVVLALRRLIAFGHYSIVVRTTGAEGTRFAAIDGSGVSNNFDAKQDGSANVVVTSPTHLVSGSAIVVVYHSDAQDHGSSSGDFGRTAHQQLIVRVP
ncbi:MAG: hypothetical protein NVSMB5_26980 [Candidatus Velthaea sp.]